MLETNKIYQGDCIEVLKTFPDNFFDSVVTDPPYGLGFMNKEWDSPEEHRRLVEREKIRSEQRFKEGKSPTTAPFSASIRPGLSIKGAKEGQWFQDWCNLWAKECFRVLKPGAYLLSFSATRTYHRMACAIEDAGFEIRDMIEWIYGSGFPKSLNIGKAVDKLQGNEREVIGQSRNGSNSLMDGLSGTETTTIQDITKGTSEWEGWGTALKPAHEPIVMARKPLSEKTVAENVLKYGTGGINIDECRIQYQNEKDKKEAENIGNSFKGKSYNTGCYQMNVGNSFIRSNFEGHISGRFPANLIHDGSDEVLEIFPKTNNQGHWAKTKVTGFGDFGGGSSEYFGVGEKDKQGGSASRFFYCAKASKGERNYGCDFYEIDNSDKYNGKFPNSKADKMKNNHPTVKPIALMEYLIKLVTRKNGIVLDPFTGSGSTLIACIKNNYQFVGIEKEEEYCKITEARLKPFLEQLKLIKNN